MLKNEPDFRATPLPGINGGATCNSKQALFPYEVKAIHGAALVPKDGEN